MWLANQVVIYRISDPSNAAEGDSILPKVHLLCCHLLLANNLHSILASEVLIWYIFSFSWKAICKKKKMISSVYEVIKLLALHLIQRNILQTTFITLPDKIKLFYNVCLLTMQRGAIQVI